VLARLGPVQHAYGGVWVEALKDAIARYAVPAIFNTDQGSQFTGDDFMFLFLRLGFLDFETGHVLWFGEGGEFGAPQRYS